MERAVTGHDDGTVKFWDVAAGRVFDTLQARRGRVTTLYLNLDRSRMLVGTDHRVLQLWDVGGKRVLRTFEYDLGRIVRLSSDQKLFHLNTTDDTVEFYDMATRRNVAKVIDPGNRINFAEAFSSSTPQAIALQPLRPTERVAGPTGLNWPKINARCSTHRRGKGSNVSMSAKTGNSRILRPGCPDLTLMRSACFRAAG
jgi:WD40 repeat protein